jgi:2-phosphosulfolactate phosphatase
MAKNIQIISSFADLKKIEGLAVVIDVFRAFSVEAYIFENNAKQIIPVASIEEAHSLKQNNPDFILIGERGGIKPEGFDFGNSPTEIAGIDFSSKTVVHSTSNGTRFLLNCTNCTEVITGSFVNAQAIINFISNSTTQEVYLISTSHLENTENEDVLCAKYIKSKLEKQNTFGDAENLKTIIKETETYSLLFDEIGVPQSDFDYCLRVNAFDFVIQFDLNKKKLEKI